MKPNRNLHAKTISFIALMVLFGPLGDVFLRMGMKRIGAIDRWTLASSLHYFRLIITSGTIWLGIGSLLMFFVCYLMVLSWADYSFVQPASAVSYLVVALLGIYVLGEAVSSGRWLGVAVICLGVLLVGHTPPRTTETEPS
jgi:drug/metabolite transporter (DMT)-like permease